MSKHAAFLFIGWAGLVVCNGCGDSQTAADPVGAIGQSCYGNGTCDAGLVCGGDGICVESSGPGYDAGTLITADADVPLVDAGVPDIVDGGTTDDEDDEGDENLITCGSETRDLSAMPACVSFANYLETTCCPQYANVITGPLHRVLCLPTASESYCQSILQTAQTVCPLVCAQL